MIFKIYFYSFITSALVGLLTLTAVLTRLDPFGANATLGLWLFLISVFLTLFGTFAIIFYNLRIHLTRTPLLSKHLFIILRYSTLLALLTVAILFFQSQGILSIGLALITFSVLILLELFFYLF